MSILGAWLRWLPDLRVLKRVPLALVALAVLSFPVLTPDSYLVSLMVLIGIYVMVAIGVDLLMGYTGQIALGQFAFFGIAGYTSGILTTRFGLPPVVALVMALALTLVVALIIGAPILKLKEYYFAIASLGLVVIFFHLATGLVDWTGGPNGLTGVPPFSLGGVVLEGNVPNYYLVWGMVGLIFVLSANIVNSQVGRAMRAIDGDELSASCMGVDVARYKLKVFLLSTAYAALAGVLYTHFYRFISPPAAGLVPTMDVVVILALGGMGTLYGALLGAIILKGIPEFIAVFADYHILIWGVLLILLMVYWPRGIVGWMSDLGEKLVHRWDATVRSSRA